MTKRKTFWILIGLIVVLGIYSIVLTPFMHSVPQQATTEQTKPDRASVIATISQEDNGPLQECTVQGSTYFFARGSMFDGSDNIYNDRGDQVAQCGGGWGVKPEPYPQICTDMYAATCTDINQNP